jgi:regulator of ribonuclease activity A
MKPTCDLYDAHLDVLGVLPAALRHFGGRIAFHGEAVTVKTHEVNTRVRELVHADGRGRVIVVDGGGSTRRALLGDVLAGAAVANGWAGLVIWGAVRDSAAIARMPLGVMALATTPRKCIRAGEGEVGALLDIAGTRVAPGDFIVADEDGALVFPKDGPRPD